MLAIGFGSSFPTDEMKRNHVPISEMTCPFPAPLPLLSEAGALCLASSMVTHETALFLAGSESTCNWIDPWPVLCSKPIICTLVQRCHAILYAGYCILDIPNSAMWTPIKGIESMLVTPMRLDENKPSVMIAFYVRTYAL